MTYTSEQRKQISEHAEGMIIQSLLWEEADGGYWVMTFIDGSEISFRFMSEIV